MPPRYADDYACSGGGLTAIAARFGRCREFQVEEYSRLPRHVEALDLYAHIAIARRLLPLVSRSLMITPGGLRWA